MRQKEKTDICWICGDKANSGEHMVKKSDLHLSFKNISQNHPIHVRKNGECKKIIGTLKSKSFHFGVKICKKCNNERTQQFDQIWEKLSKYLYDNWRIILNDGYINLKNIFGTKIQESMLCVQLFFLKIFGCKCIEAEINFNMNKFSKAILNKKEQSDFYISFRNSEHNFTDNYCVSSDIQILKANKPEEIIYMHQFYTIGKITVDMIYAPNKDIIDLNGALKPSEISMILPLSKLTYNQSYVSI